MGHPLPAFHLFSVSSETVQFYKKINVKNYISHLVLGFELTNCSLLMC